MTMLTILAVVAVAGMVFVAGALCGYQLGTHGPDAQEVGDEGFIDVEPAIRAANRDTWPRGFPTREDVIRSPLWRQWRFGCSEAETKS